ncbi:MAG: TIGR03617 family F420-dependent LLM class oxidoreductase [Chloroflexota bacterium]
MFFDALITPGSLREAGTIAEQAEQIGFDAIWTTETAHDPFLPLVPAAIATTTLKMGTAVAIAFPRSPTLIAHTSWDLARESSGRFILGLGTQVKAHIERRFATSWDAPVERLRDYIGAVRAVWHSWQTGERLRYESEHYTLKLMTPFFSPEPLPDPAYLPPIFIAGVNRRLCRLAGEVCDGFHVHPFHTARYLREAVLPWIEGGLRAAGRSRADIQVSASVFLITGQGTERDNMREEVRRQVAFYASTPSYRTLLTMHGWDAAGEELTRLAGRGRWQQMGDLITDEMLAEFAVEAPSLPEAALLLRNRYNGLLDRTAFYLPFVSGHRDDEWRSAILALMG